MANKVYIYHHDAAILAGNTFTDTFILQNVNREMKIKSITIDTAFWDSVQYVPVNLQTQIFAELEINYTLLSQQSSFVGCIGFTGSYFVLYSPKQYIFDSFFIMSDLDFRLHIFNKSALKYTAHYTLIVEVEEKNIYL